MKRSPKRKVDPLEVQLSIHARVPKNAALSKDLLDEVVDEWARTGRSPRGFEVAVVRWRNPARNAQGKRTWRAAKTEQEKNCKLIRRALRHGARFTLIAPLRIDTQPR